MKNVNNITKLFEVIMDDKFIHLVMDYSPDGDLLNYIIKNQSAIQDKSNETVVKIIMQ